MTKIEFKSVPLCEFGGMKTRVNVMRAIAILLFTLASGFSQVCYAANQEDAPTLKEVIEESDKNKAATKAIVENTDPSKPAGTTDKLGRDVPRSAVAGYINAAKASEFEKAAEFLDLRKLPRGYSESDGPDLARHLKVILDRALWVDLDILSADPKGHSNDNLPSYRDFVGQIDLNDRKVDILLQRVPRGDGVYIWKFSTATVRNIPKLYREYGYGELGEKLYLSLPDFSFLTLQLWQWAILLMIVAGAYAIAFVPSYLLGSIFRRKETEQAQLWASFITGPARWLLVVIIGKNWLDIIHPSLETRALINAGTVQTIVVTWLIIQAVDIILGYWNKKLIRMNREHATVLLRPVATAVKIIIILVALLVWLDNIGYKVSTLLAGLGIGGLAVALAAQKSIENLIGAATLYMAAPVRVGDFCRFGDKLGTVEEIGLRSTRLRTLDRTVVSVPNADFASMQLENFADREKIRFNPKLHLRYETKPEQIRQIITEIKKLLDEHSQIGETPISVRFIGFGTYSLEISILAFVMTTDYMEFLEITEQLNIRILEIVEAAGAELATQTQGLFKE
jgi:MscS family membrane protein